MLVFLTYTFDITAYFLDCDDWDGVEFKYLQRAASNPIILGEPGDPRKMYIIGNFGDYFKRNKRHKEAQALFTHVIDSNLIPPDLYRFYLAESYTLSEDYVKAAEIATYLYCKREFKVNQKFLSIFEEYNKVCLREAVYDVLNRWGKPYLRKSIEHQKKGEALRAAGDRAGKNCCNHSSPIYASPRHTV